MKIKRITNKELLLDTTMQIIAEGGLAFFSMRQVTDACGVSDSLIYRHYETKEKLLFQCYLRVEQKIQALFEQEAIPVIETREDLCRHIHDIWIKYISFLVQNPYQTIFYFEYRDSKYYRSEKTVDRMPFCFWSARAFLEQHANCKLRLEYCRMYLSDVTGSFARRMIGGELSSDSESMELIWNLLWSGFSNLVKSGEVYKTLR